MTASSRGRGLRTLVVSDLHLGSQTKRDVLRSPPSRAPLLEAAAACDRLVLLGDLLELRHGPQRDALRAAREPLTEIATALGPGTEVLIVPGNHDHALLAAWFQRRARGGPPAPLELETEVDWRPGEPLAELAGWFDGARVRSAYPGVWLRPDVYATHGHYADLHLTMPTIERLAAGVMGRIVGLPADGPRSAEEYEAALAPIYAWIHALAQRIAPELGGSLHGGSVKGWSALTGPGRRGLRRRAVAAGFPVLVAACNRAGIGPLRADLSGAALRRSGLRGLELALGGLAIQAPHVIFGHTHRAGPLPGDDGAEWRTATGTQLINSGCWVQEPSFLGRDPARSPYRVGFCVWVSGEGPPELANLLD
ncbi:MAG: metallophosphoesterase [Solirubrobacteraceae bacterium]